MTHASRRTMIRAPFHSLSFPFAASVGLTLSRARPGHVMAPYPGLAVRESVDTPLPALAFARPSRPPSASRQGPWWG